MIGYIETHIVDHCNLKCRGCSHFSGLATPYYKPLNDYEVEMRQLSLITNKRVRTIRIMGGEPLLHPDVVKFCTITRELFPSSEIVLVSNGILLGKLSDEDIQILNDNDIALCISDYGLQLNQTQLKKFKTYYFHGKTSLYNISLDLSKTQDFVHSFYNCDIVKGKWYFFKNGRLYQCCVMANIDYFNKTFNTNIDFDLDDISISIFNHNLGDIERFLQTPHDVCAYCDTITRKHTYAKFQVSKGDIKEWTI